MVKLFLILFNLSLVHPVHVSMASLYGDKDSGDMVLSVRMYTDDLALDLYRLYDAEGDYSEFDHMFIFTGSDSYYEKYINEHLKIYHGDKVLGIELVKKEILDLETLLTFSVNIEDFPEGDINVENKILTGMYIDQVNLFILKLDNFEKGVKFTASKTKEMFSR